MVLKLTHQRRSGVKTHPPKRRVSLLWLPLLCGAMFLAYKQLQVRLAEPQAVFVLGGLEAREIYAAKLAQQNPELEVWVSSGSPEAYVKQVFANAGVAGDRLHLNYEAQDTITNFTTLVDDLEAQGIDSVYLITSENHMQRARIIGEVVFGSRGIVIKPLAIAEGGIAEENLTKSLLDGGRALLWLLTGNTASSLKDEIVPQLPL